MLTIAIFFYKSGQIVKASGTPFALQPALEHSHQPFSAPKKPTEVNCFSAHSEEKKIYIG